MNSNKISLLWLIITLFCAVLSAEPIDFETDAPYSVSIVGAINNPGTYPILGNTRVSELIKIANVVIDSLADESDKISEISSVRGIILKRQNKQTTLDLQKFYILGDIEQNPYLLDGDVVVIPAKSCTVSIVGAVHQEGIFEITKNDKITDILGLTFGLRNDADLQAVEIVRFVNNSDSIKTITVNLEKILKNPESNKNIFLQNDDRIYIRSIPEFHKQNHIKIFGEIKYPGIYAIEEDISTLFEVLNMAGGPTYRADLKNSFLQRKSHEDLLDPEFNRLKKMTIDEMTTIEYEYFKAKSRELRGKFSANFEKIWENHQSSEVTLKNNDYIYVSRQISTVNITGSIKNPGLISFIPNQNYLYYIEKSGGLAWNAKKNKIRIIKTSTGEWLKPNKKTIIEVGDMIFVPEKSEHDYWQITKDIMKIMAEIATVVIVIQNTTQ
ncbi:MAG: hypothetical protein HN952_01455 [Candidatus Cloacimonetes bacterium]|nr:hypothetical protein [Candidatus Cloacimonadota bacterium]MBT6993600.1 hypothetical protein [Candidatus Cloacimonadota bacterium]